VDEAVKLLMGMPVSFAELDGQNGYAELIGELDRLLVYYRRTVAVRKGRRSAAKERAKSRKHRSNPDMQGSQSERNERNERDRDELNKWDERGEQDKFEKPQKYDAPDVPDLLSRVPDVAEAQRMKRSSGLLHMDFSEESRQAIADMRNVPSKVPDALGVPSLLPRMPDVPNMPDVRNVPDVPNALSRVPV
jgi:hypothetical protein